MIRLWFRLVHYVRFTSLLLSANNVIGVSEDNVSEIGRLRMKMTIMAMGTWARHVRHVLSCRARWSLSYIAHRAFACALSNWHPTDIAALTFFLFPSDSPSLFTRRLFVCRMVSKCKRPSTELSTTVKFFRTLNVCCLFLPLIFHCQIFFNQRL